jgi:ketosteroid isomerase-like protein
MRIAPQVVLTSEQRAKLEAYARGRSTPARVVLRARIVLLAAEGKQDLKIARLLSIVPRTAARWRSRFLRNGIAGLEHDAPRPGRTPSISPDLVRMVIAKTTQERPPWPQALNDNFENIIRGRIMHSSRFNDGDKKMDELYAINAAKSEFRDSFNFSDPSRFLAIADPELVSFSDGQASEFGESGLESFKTRLENLFERFTARLAVTVNEIRLHGDVAYDYGCHELTLTPKHGGEPVHRRNRYVDIWRRNKEGEWKLWMYMDNLDVADPFQPEATRPMQRDATAA